MATLLPALHEGHAPVHLHLAFSEALEAYEGWRHGEIEPAVEFEGRLVAVSAVFGRMRSCTDLLPMRVAEDIAAAIPGEATFEGSDSQATYAEAARVLRALCVARLRGEDDRVREGTSN